MFCLRRIGSTSSSSCYKEACHSHQSDDDDGSHGDDGQSQMDDDDGESHQSLRGGDESPHDGDESLRDDVRGDVRAYLLISSI